MKLNKTLATASILAMLPMASSAAVISWGTSVNLFAGGDNGNFISTNGTGVMAFNAAGATTTVNTVEFTAADKTTPGVNSIEAFSYIQGGATLATTSNSAGPTTFANGEFTDAGVSALIGSALYNFGSTINLSGLTDGQSYEIQILVNDARGGSGAGIRDTAWEVAFTDGDDDTTIAGLADLTNRPLNDSGDPNLAGDYIIGTFTAVGTTQSFLMGATRAGDLTIGGAYSSPNNGQAQINAFQLRAVPEPSSTALLGLGGLALILRRRK